MQNQMTSNKKTEPIYHIGKAERNSKNGIFPVHMSKSPTRIRIDHPRL
jgi:hypothetical protein